MGIKANFSCKCDKCECAFINVCGNIMFCDKGLLVRQLKGYDWKKIDNKWYCPECKK